MRARPIRRPEADSHASSMVSWLVAAGTVLAMPLLCALGAIDQRLWALAAVPLSFGLGVAAAWILGWRPPPPPAPVPEPRSWARGAAGMLIAISPTGPASLEGAPVSWQALDLGVEVPRVLVHGGWWSCDMLTGLDPFLLTVGPPAGVHSSGPDPEPLRMYRDQRVERVLGFRCCGAEYALVRWPGPGRPAYGVVALAALRS